MLSCCLFFHYSLCPPCTTGVKSWPPRYRKLLRGPAVCRTLGHSRHEHATLRLKSWCRVPAMPQPTQRLRFLGFLLMLKVCPSNLNLGPTSIRHQEVFGQTRTPPFIYAGSRVLVWKSDPDRVAEPGSRIL